MNRTMKTNIIQLIVIILLSCTQITCANDISGENKTTEGITKIYALKDYQEDFNQMVELLLKKHPQPFEFISEDSLKNLINLKYDEITDSTTMGRFLWICREVAAAINCGHTEAWSFEVYRVPISMVFPVNVRYVGSKLYVIDAKNNSNSLTVGDEILTINGVDAKTLQEAIFKHHPSDGYNESSKQEGTNLLFGPYCSMYYNFPKAYTVTVNKNESIDEISLVEAENLNPTRTFLDNCENQLCFDMNNESNTATITIRSFGYYKKQFPIFKSFIDSCFLQVKENEIQNLIIDLRNNGGGDPFCSSYLLQYIANKPFTYFHKDVKWYSKLKKTIQPNPNGFKKKPYILTNGLCFSTTGHFCSIVKENNFGIIVGDETGGTYTCNDNSKIYTLKNTKVLFKVARNTYKTTAITLTNKHGIIPDHYVIPDLDNILKNTDTVLNYTLRFIEKK